jgi:protein O-GlcNAc transferase
MMDVRETTAHSLDEFVAIATTLGRDKAMRRDISLRTSQQKSRVYRDLRSIKGLESFLDRAVRNSIDPT